MNILVINGTLRKGSTWHISQILVEQLSSQIPFTVKEVHLPTDLPHFCVGCFQCITKGESYCPHHEKVSAIEQAMIEADCIIITSPVYSYDVSASLKNLLDHFAYRWMPHRPHPSMFKKVAVTITTASGAGTKHTTKTMRQSLDFWGIGKVYSLKFNVAAMSFDEINEQTKRRIIKAVDATAAKILKLMSEPQVPVSLKTRGLFLIMRQMQKGNDWNLTDRNFWQENGWLNHKRPY
jgi:multimeric flavodoxin WrbA